MSSGLPDRRITRSLANLLELSKEFCESQIENDLLVATHTEEARQVRPRKKKTHRGNQKRRTPTLPIPKDLGLSAERQEQKQFTELENIKADNREERDTPERDMPPSYTNWDERPSVHPHQWNDWASYADINMILRDVRKVRFAIAESRNQGLKALDRLPAHAVVGPTLRFPDTGMYFNVDSPQFASLWSRLRSLLGYKDARETSARGAVELAAAQAQAYNDSARGFQAALAEVTLFINNGDQRWSRGRYENDYMLNWDDLAAAN